MWGSYQEGVLCSISWSNRGIGCAENISFYIKTYPTMHFYSSFANETIVFGVCFHYIFDMSLALSGIYYTATGKINEITY